MKVLIERSVFTNTQNSCGNTRSYAAEVRAKGKKIMVNIKLHPFY